MKKRIFSMLLAVALILSLGVTSVIAAGEKFDAKNNVNIVYFGGSQTQIGLEEGGWCHKVTDWFSQKYTGTTFTTVDAAYGGMGSNWGFMRAKADVINKNADIVFIDFALNDNSVYGTGAVNEENGLSYIEAMVRNIMSAKEAPKVFFIYTCKKSQITDESAKTTHKKSLYNKIAQYYGIPEIDIHDEFCKLDNVDDLFRSDDVHFSAAGNEKVGELAVSKLETEGFIKAPTLKSDLYIHANRYSAYSPDEYKVVDLYNDGKLTTTGEWEVVDQTGTAPSYIGNMDLKYINPKTEDSTFSYDFKGDMIGFKFILNSNGADAEIYIDDVLKGTLVMNGTSNFPNAYMWKDLGEGWHTLKVVPKSIEGNCYIEKIYTDANARLHSTQSVVTKRIASNPIQNMTYNSIAFMNKVGWNNGLNNIHYIHHDITKADKTGVNNLNFIYRPSMKLLVDDNNMIVSKRTGVKYYFRGTSAADFVNAAIAVPAAGYTVSLGNVNAKSVNFVATSRDYHYPESVDIEDYKVTINYTDGSSEDNYLTIYDYLVNNDRVIASPYIIQGNGKPVMDAKYNMFEYSVPVQSGKTVKSITFGANQTSVMVYAVTTVSEEVESSPISLINKNSIAYFEGPGWNTGNGANADVIYGMYSFIHRTSMKTFLDASGILTSKYTGVKYDFSTVLKADYKENGAVITTGANNGYSINYGDKELETINFIATSRKEEKNSKIDLADYKVVVNYTDGTSEEKTLTIYGAGTSNNQIVANPYLIYGYKTPVTTETYNMFEYVIPVNKSVKSLTFKSGQTPIILFAASGKLKDQTKKSVVSTTFDITKYCDSRPTAKAGETGNLTGNDALNTNYLVIQENIEAKLDSELCHTSNGMRYSFAQLKNPARRAIHVGTTKTKTIDVGGDYYSKIGFFAIRQSADSVDGTLPVTLNYVDGSSEVKNVTLGNNSNGQGGTGYALLGNVLGKTSWTSEQTSATAVHPFNYVITVDSTKALESVTFGASDTAVSCWILSVAGLGRDSFEASNGVLKTNDEVMEDLGAVAGEKVNLTFKTKAVSETKYDLMVVFYSENGTKLEKIDYYNCKNNLGLKNETFEITIPENADSDWTVKAFLWNEFTGMTPIHDALIIK